MAGSTQVVVGFTALTSDRQYVHALIPTLIVSYRNGVAHITDESLILPNANIHLSLGHQMVENDAINYFFIENHN